MKYESPETSRISFYIDGEARCIKIPPRRNWFIIAFLGIWFCMWTIGGVTIGLVAIVGVLNASAEGLVLGLFSCFWLAVWCYVFAILSWKIFGHEIIAIEAEGISHTLKSPLFARTKSYRLSDITRLRWSEQNAAISLYTNFPGFFSSANYGALHFDYGAKTISLGNGVDSGEGYHIIDAIETARRKDEVA